MHLNENEERFVTLINIQFVKSAFSYEFTAIGWFFFLIDT